MSSNSLPNSGTASSGSRRNIGYTLSRSRPPPSIAESSKPSQNNSGASRQTGNRNVASYHPTQHTKDVARWQQKFAEGLQSATQDPETLERAKNYTEEELQAAGALMALSRPVNPDPQARDERLAKPKLWSKETIAMGVDITAKRLGSDTGSRD